MNAGESYRGCAIRELKEELGVTVGLTDLDRIPASEVTGYEFIEIFFGTHDGPFSCNPYEIETGGFFELEMIDMWIERRPADFASGFIECYRSVRGRLGNAERLIARQADTSHRPPFTEQ